MAKTILDASYYEILGNVPGKEQNGISLPILKFWGEVEVWYGDYKKCESGRDFLLRIQDAYQIEFKEPQKDTRKKYTKLELPDGEYFEFNDGFLTVDVGLNPVVLNKSDLLDLRAFLNQLPLD